PHDPRYTFDSFVVGPANRMAHAAATQVADTVLADDRGFNPLYLHASVGLGKTQLQHAIAWPVKRRTPKANVLYLTAGRFRYPFVEAVNAQDAVAFKYQIRSLDLPLIDELAASRGASRSRTSYASSRGISPCPSRTSFRSAATAPWCGQGRSACISPSI